MKQEHTKITEWETGTDEVGPAAEYRFELTRREFLQGLGGGILVLAVCREEAVAQEAGGRRRRRGEELPQQLSAWLHVDDDGTVTVYTGKAEMGQNIRTSLSQAVAEELHTPLDSVRLVMGDTGLCPFDMGTFGSRTTPTMAPQLRRAAATARELLVDLAAEKWQVTRDSIVVTAGKVTHPPTRRSCGFGELAKGRELTKTIAAAVALIPATDWKIDGTSAAKVNGRQLVTGEHRYASDVTRPGMLHGKIVRPPAFGAALVSADTSEAAKLPGVVVVRDGDFLGVAAPSVALAEQAREAVRAEWRTSPQLSENELFAHFKKTASRGRPQRSEGSVPPALAAADHKLNATYTVAYIAHAPLEPRAAVAEWEGGKLTVWTGSQRPFGVKEELVQAFRVPEDRVRVIVPDTGSGYGGKHTGEAAVEAARLAKAAGKPVKLIWTREEEFTWAYFRPAGLLEVSAGVRKDGTITAWEFHNYNSGPSALLTPYAIPNQLSEFHPAESPLRQGSYRALSATANHFARETAMDELAHAVAMDPLDFRLKNLTDDRLRAVFTAAAERFGFGPVGPRRAQHPSGGRGYGIAGGVEKGGYAATCAEVTVNPADGKVRVVRLVTAFECGAVVNPSQLRNQIEGVAMMGLGGALFEAIRFENGKILNPHFASYRVPRCADLPALDAVLVNRKDLPSAGAGETPIVGIAPAIGNAIFAATGVRLRSMPLAPDGVKA